MFGHSRRYVLRHPRLFYRGVTSAIVTAFQRARRGYAESDVWNLDSYLATIIAGGCRVMRDKGQAFPGVSEADTVEKWHAILTTIAEGFDIAAQNDLWRQEDGHWIAWEDEYALGINRHKVYDASWDEHPKYLEAMQLFVQWYPALWD